MHAYQNLPLYSINVKIFLKWGFIGTPSRAKQFLVTFVPVLSLIGVIINIFKTLDEDISETGLNFFLLAVIINILIKHLMVSRKDVDFQRFLKCVAEWYNAMASYEDQQIPRLLLDITRRAQKLTRIGFYAAGAGTVCALLYPFSFEERKLVVEMQYPFFDAKQTPFYEIIFLIQAFVLIPTFVCVYLPFTNLLLTFLMFGEVALLDLRLKLQNINKEDQTKMLEDLKECIAYHKKIITFRDDLENLVSTASFFDVALFGLMFCMLLFFISMVHDFQLIFTAVIYIGFTFYMVGISFYFANNFTNEGLEISNVVYDTPWYEGNFEMRKCVLIMIARCQRPLQITTGGIYPMTLENFQAILRVSYSYFSMLQGLSQQ